MNIWEKIEHAYMIACRSTDYLGVATNKGEEQTQEKLFQRLAYAHRDLESAISIVEEVQGQLLAEE